MRHSARKVALWIGVASLVPITASVSPGAVGVLTATAHAAAALSSCAVGADPYSATDAQRAACGVQGFPLESEATQSNGLRTYSYVIEGVATTYYVPPAGFDPATASDEQLAEYHLPARPTDPTAQSQWNSSVGRASFAAPPQTIYDDPGVKGATSPNWSGWLETGHSYTSSTAYWYEPGIFSGNCNTSTTSVVFWSGLGGFNTGYLAQDGTGENTPGLGQNQAWSEVLPQQPYVVPQSLYATIGQDFEAYTGWTGGNNFVFFMENLYTGQSLYYGVTANGYDGSTAEQVVERPTVGGKYAYLSNYHNVLFNNNQNTWSGGGGYISGSPNQSITMYNGSRQLTSESGLGGSGSFTDYQLWCGD